MTAERKMIPTKKIPTSVIIKLNVRAARFAVYLLYNLNMYGRQSNLFLSSSTG